jgi:hypothetical protein
MSELLGWAQTIATCSVCIITGWYAYETFKLRAIASRQLDKMIEQSVASRLPYVLGGVITRPSLGDIRFNGIVDEISSRYQIRKIQISSSSVKAVALQESNSHAFEVTSATDQVASHVWVVWFDHSSNTFAVATHQLEVIAPRETGYFASSEFCLTYENVKEIMDMLYEGRAAEIRDKVIALCKSGKEHAVSYLIPIFFDLGGRLYATPRAIYSRNNVIAYGKSDLLQPNTIEGTFAPPFDSTRKAIS